jgi:hypothetical protein
MAFVIHANLDAEARWAGAALPARIAERVSYYAALAAFLAHGELAGDDVEVWVPAAIDERRLTFAAGIHAGTPPEADLVWAPDAAKAANDRRLATRLAAEAGIGVPGARVIASADEIEIPGAWVAKAPWTSAGRDRCHGEGAPTGEQRTRLSRLLAQFGALVLEPWLPRAVDVGVCAMAVPGIGGQISPPHGLITDARGTFLGIDLAPPPLAAEQRARLDGFVRAVRDQLPYAGPIAVDAFVTTDGQLCVCEINARFSFGWIARALARRHGITKLGFSAPPPGAHVLVEPRNDGICAWMM